MAKPSLGYEILGCLCIFLLEIIKRAPLSFLKFISKILLPAYLLLRHKHCEKLKVLWNKSQINLDLQTYYNNRINTALHYVKSHFYQRNLDLLEIRGKEHINKLLHLNQPIVLCGIHCGPFELQHQIPFREQLLPGSGPKILVANPAFSLALESYVHKIRKQSEIQLIPPHRLGKHLKSWVLNNGVLAMMVDQCPPPQKWKLKLFNHLEIPVPLKTLQWCGQKKAALLPISSYWEAEKPILEFHKPLLPKNGVPDSKDDENSKVENFVKTFLESQILAHPAQWNWSYPPLKTAP